MNQSDYKKIAKIIKENSGNVLGELFIHDNIIEELADYFEEEDVWQGSSRQEFDRKQFLKDCGVEE